MNRDQGESILYFPTNEKTLRNNSTIEAVAIN